MKRLLAGFVGTTLFLLPGVTAFADDDPAPQKWPAVQDFGTSGGTADDPKPNTWPDVDQPGTDSSADPKPTTWPALAGARQCQPGCSPVLDRCSPGSAGGYLYRWRPASRQY